MASEATDVVRVAGTTRYGTAADAATSAYPAGAANVVLASGEKFPDALAGGGLAGSLDAPILLTQQNALPAETTAALAELDAETVTILGGTSAVSAAVETALETAGYTVDRVGGADRFETAALIAEELGGTTAVLANGLRFPDALAISPGAHALELPLLLTTVDGLHEDAAAYIDGNAVDEVIIVGGTAVVSQATEDALEADGITVTRLAGADRYASSVEIAEFHVTQGFTLDEVVMATGEKFPDALAGGPYASQLGAPMVLTQTATLTPATAAFLTSNCQAIDALSILGGTAAITTAVETAAAAAAQCDTNATVGATPGTTTAAAYDRTSGNGEIQTVTFSGLDPAKDYDIETIPCSDYSGPSVLNDGVNVLDGNGVSNLDGTITFSDQDFDDIADDLGNDMYGNVDILTVGFTAINANTADDQSPDANGTFTVRVQGDGGDCVHIVAFEDNAAADDDALNLGNSTPASPVDNNNVPTDAFGISGAIYWTSGEALTGDELDDDCIVYLDKANDFFVLGGDGALYNYGDAGDTYWYNDHGGDVNSTITLAEFENVLSLGDCLSNDNTGSAYTRTGNNVFEISHDYVTAVPSAPTVGAIGNLDGDADLSDVTFSWTDPNPGADIDQYQVSIYDAATGAFVQSDTTDEVDTVGGGDALMSLVIEDVPDGSYVATVAGDSESNDGFFDESLFSAPFLVGAAADTAAPTITDARVVADALLQNRVDAGDQFRLTFSEDMSDTLDSTGLFQVTDVDGDVYNLDCADVANVTCVLSDVDVTTVDRILTITVVAVTDIGAGGDGILEIPGTITTIDADVEDQAGNVANLAGSADVLIDKEA